MPESRIDPRHSAAFQRGYSGGESPAGHIAGSGTASAPFQRGYQPSPSSSRPEVRSDAPPSRWALHDETSATAAEVDEVFAELSPASNCANGDAQHEEDSEQALADRRRFRFWSIALFAVGVGLVVASFLMFLEGWNTFYNGATTTSSDGITTVQTPDGPREITMLEYQLAQYRSSIAPWVGAVGVATIVGNLFRIAGRR